MTDVIGTLYKYEKVGHCWNDTLIPILGFCYIENSKEAQF